MKVLRILSWFWVCGFSGGMETSLVMAAVAGTGVVIPRVRSHSAQQQQRSVVSSSSSVFLGRRRGCGISRVGLVTEVGGGYRRRSSFGKLRVSRPVAEAPPPSVGKVDHLSPTQLLPGDEDGVSDIQRLATKGADRKKSLNDVDEKDLKDKTVFVRCDLNVPLDENCRITDDTRIRASLPTIQFLVKIGARVVLASHLGRPKKGPEAKFSLKPVAGMCKKHWVQPFLLFSSKFYARVSCSVNCLHLMYCNKLGSCISGKQSVLLSCWDRR